MKIFFILILLLVAFQGLTFGQFKSDLQKIKNIKLLKSTRKEVKEIFGQTRSELNDYHDEFFVWNKSTIQISYSLGTCQKANHIWNVPEWVVIEIYVTMGTPEDIGFNPMLHTEEPEQLGFKLSQFKAAPPSDVVGGQSYTNNIEGIMLGTINGKLTDINFYPANKYSYLACKENHVGNIKNSLLRLE